MCSYMTWFTAVQVAASEKRRLHNISHILLVELISTSDPRSPVRQGMRGLVGTSVRLLACSVL